MSACPPFLFHVRHAYLFPFFCRMEATHKRQKLEDDLRKAQADVFGSLVRRRIKQFWRSAEEERKLLLNTIIASWSRAAANQERFVFALYCI